MGASKGNMTGKQLYLAICIAVVALFATIHIVHQGHRISGLEAHIGKVENEFREYRQQTDLDISLLRSGTETQSNLTKAVMREIGMLQ